MGIIEFIRTILESKGVDPKVINAIPVYIQRAIIKLQLKDLFPPTLVSYVAEEVKETDAKADGSIRYNYFTAPQDYRELKEFDVDGIRYFWFENYQNMQTESAKRQENLFTIREVTNPVSGKREKRFILEPYPPAGKEINLWYYVDGSEACFDKLDKDYWEAILTTIEGDLGLADKYWSESAVSDTVNQQKNREGYNQANKTARRVKPNFFGASPWLAKKPY
jgi:hypothetical protein